MGDLDSSVLWGRASGVHSTTLEWSGQRDGECQYVPWALSIDECQSARDGDRAGFLEPNADAYVNDSTDLVAERVPDHYDNTFAVGYPHDDADLPSEPSHGRGRGSGHAGWVECVA